MEEIINKQNNILSWFFIIMILFMTGICVLIAFIITSTTIAIPAFQADADANAAVNMTHQTILNFDNMMLFMVVGLSLFVIISASLVYQHPAFFIISFLLLIIAIVFSGIISNTFYTFWNTDTIVDAASNFPKIRFIMEKLPFYILFMGMAATVAGYVSYRKEV